MVFSQLSKQWTKQVEHEITLLFACMGDNWVPAPLNREHDKHSNENTFVTEGHHNGMDASGIQSTHTNSQRH